MENNNKINTLPILFELDGNPDIKDGKVFDVKTLDAFSFVLNTFAMGDVIAAVPVVKYMIEKFYTNPNTYRVVAKQSFRDLFHFVPSANFLDYDKKENLWGIPQGFAIGTLNRKNEPRLTRITPKSLHLSDYASLSFCDRLISRENLNYVSLIPTDISKFGVFFKRAVILVSTYRDQTRSWRNESILETAEWIKQQGYTPVFVGKTNDEQHLSEAHRPKSMLPDDLSDYGVDLRNKTNLRELFTIFSESAAVLGVDSGPIHLAGTTSVPIICGYTSVAAEHRIPIRKHGVTYPIQVDIPCINCESRWRTNYWNFENCFTKTEDCSKLLTADRFIDILKHII